VFEGLGAALVATRDERDAGSGDRRERRDRVTAARDMRRVPRGPTTMKSFQAICRRSTPCPWAMN